jgi:two-component system, response regulator, stage 0 sporulation protein F
MPAPVAGRGLFALFGCHERFLAVIIAHFGRYGAQPVEMWDEVFPNMESRNSKPGDIQHTDTDRSVLSKLSSISILAVDDEENFLTLLHWFLTQRGYQVTTALSAERALNLLDGQFFDIALVDLKLGISDGLALVDQLTARLPKIRVFVMTAYPTVDSIKQAFNKGAVRYLTKPVDLQELAKSLNSII